MAKKVDKDSARHAELHARLHREEILTSRRCGCFLCEKTFSPLAITSWVCDGATALCPTCGTETGIGDASGYRVTRALLAEMNWYWFRPMTFADDSVAAESTELRVMFDIVRAHGHCSNHRDNVLASDTCGCFYCKRTFPPSAITDWIDDDPATGLGQTAMCPCCDIDAVIGSASGYPITSTFLHAMHERWF
jgi:hypothetical protein